MKPEFLRGLVLWLAVCFWHPVFALTHSQPALDDSFQSGVWIGSDAQDPQAYPVTGYCNATLLSPTILVTAAHCVAQAWFLESKQISITVGKYRYVTNPNGQQVRIGYVDTFTKRVQAAFHLNSQAQTELKNHGIGATLKPVMDQAVIELQAPLDLPADFTFRKLVARDRAVEIAKQVMTYSPHVMSVNPIAEVSTIDTKRIGALNSLDFRSNGYFKSRSTVGLDEGDSGAGLLVQVDGELQLLGFAAGHAKSGFGSWDAFAIGAGEVCEIARSARLSAEEIRVLCR